MDLRTISEWNARIFELKEGSMDQVQELMRSEKGEWELIGG